MKNEVRFDLRVCVALLAIGLAAAGSATTQANDEAEPAAGKPRLDLDTREWNFGTVWQGTPVEGEITITNVGDAPLRIEDVKTSCGCTTPSKLKDVLQPGESDVLKIGYATRTRLGEARQRITLITNDPAIPKAAITVVGNVKPLYELKPRGGLSFGKLQANVGESRTADIVNKAEHPLKLELIQGQDFAPFSVRLEEVDPGAHYRLHARIDPPIPPGNVNRFVKLKTNYENMPILTVTAYGFVPPPVSVDRKFINFPKSSVMEMQVRLWVKRSAGSAVEVKAARSTHSAIQVEFREIPDEEAATARGDYEVIVTLPPGDRIEEDAEAAIEIVTDAKDEAYRKLVIPVKVFVPGR